MALWLLLLIPQLLAGALKEMANPPASTYQEMAHRAVAEYNEVSGDPHKWDLSSIDEVRQQQPNGIHTMHSSFQHEELLQHIKPKDYDAWKQFVDFMLKYKKMYNGKQDVLKRFKIFKQNLKVIQEWQKRDKGTAVYGITKFSDLTSSEFEKTYLPYIWDEPMVPNRMVDLMAEGIDGNDTLPESFDWRDHGAVTEVKDQGFCGSCWAFSTTGNIEGQWFLAKKQLVSLSEQELLDCDKVDEGCDGGLPSLAYKEIMRLGGLETEKAYPYDAMDEKCHMNRSEVAVYINGSVEIPHDEQIMKKWLVKKGPISIGINANTLQFYGSGILYPDAIFCSPSMLNHGVLIVGYGKEKNITYWIIKNSWGPMWGEEGYFRLYFGQNACGVHEMPTSAIVN